MKLCPPTLYFFLGRFILCTCNPCTNFILTLTQIATTQRCHCLLTRNHIHILIQLVVKTFFIAQLKNELEKDPKRLRVGVKMTKQRIRTHLIRQRGTSMVFSSFTSICFTRARKHFYAQQTAKNTVLPAFKSGKMLCS